MPRLTQSIKLSSYYLWLFQKTMKSAFAEKRLEAAVFRLRTFLLFLENAVIRAIPFDLLYSGEIFLDAFTFGFGAARTARCVLKSI